MQTNEFARKERYLATENYYAPDAAAGRQLEWFSRKNPQPVHAAETEAAPAVEEAFGENKKTGAVKQTGTSVTPREKASAEAGKTGDGRNAG